MHAAHAMPSQEHEALVELFRADPALVLALLGALGVAVPGACGARGLDTAFGALAVDYHADSVAEVLGPSDARELVVIVEVQLAVDPDKHRAWPLYLANARARYGAPACVLVVALRADVESWARQPVPLGPGGSVFKALVVGPSAVPRVTDDAAARAEPELAVLSAVVHGDDADVGLAIALAALEAAAPLEEPRARLYFDVIMGALGPAARRALEDGMDLRKYEYKSEFARKYVAQGREEGRAEGETKGRAEGETKGRAEGETKGRTEAKADALITVLRARGLGPTEADAARIRRMQDVTTLDVWIARAATAARVEDVLLDP